MDGLVKFECLRCGRHMDVFGWREDVHPYPWCDGCGGVTRPYEFPDRRRPDLAGLGACAATSVDPFPTPIESHSTGQETTP